MNAKQYIFRLQILLLMTTGLVVKGQNHFLIDVDVVGLQDTQLILSHRYGDRFYSDDTIRVDENGHGQFRGDSLLPQGMYQMVLPDKTFVDFFVDNQQEFSLQFTNGNRFGDIRSKDHELNQLFFDWRRKIENLTDEDEKTHAWDTTIQRAGETIVGKFISGIRPFYVPQDVQQSESWKSQEFQYNYYKDHFFDRVDFTDARLLRTPLIHTKLSQFFDKVAPQNPDSLIFYAKQVIEKSRPEPEMFRFVLQSLFNLYAVPKVMGTDAVYVYLADNYYFKGEAYWLDESNLSIIKERVAELRPMLLGNKAPHVKGLETPEGEMKDFHAIPAKFIILYFWEPECSHCQEATPELLKIYHLFKRYGVEVFAINTRLEKEPWVKFIAEHELDWINVYAPVTYREVLTTFQAYSTPKILILNKDKVIIAKDLAVNQINDFLARLVVKRLP